MHPLDQPLASFHNHSGIKAPIAHQADRQLTEGTFGRHASSSVNGTEAPADSVRGVDASSLWSSGTALKGGVGNIDETHAAQQQTSAAAGELGQAAAFTATSLTSVREQPKHHLA
jgi:hypothetical protein